MTTIDKLLFDLKKIILLVTASCLFLTFSQAQSTGEVVNLGLYGGASTDFSWSLTGNRLFSTVETPASLFYSDDTCMTWTQPFPIDSLEYETNGTRRGWGGGGVRVVSNSIGWIAALTNEQGGTLTSSVVSWDNGDSASFSTAYDGYLLNQVDNTYNSGSTTSAIAITDSWVYIGLCNALVRINETSTYTTDDILLNLDTSSLAYPNTEIKWISASYDTIGYPVLFVAKDENDQKGRLFSYEGTMISEITGIPSECCFERVFTHPLDYNLDTIIVSVVDTSNYNQRKIFKSLDGGSSWIDITPGGFSVNWALQNADYSPEWVSLMPSSNGLRLSFPGVEKSDDLGATWSNHMLEDNATATMPTDTNFVVGSQSKGPLLAVSGAQSTFIVADNEGHAAVKITKIAQKGTNIYYVATKAGLGYTIAYKDPAVQGVDQWRPPYGDFPISGVGNDGGITAVAIDPLDSLHVIAGYSGGFYITTTGATGFSQVEPSGWESATNLDYTVTDVTFVTSDTIIAVTGTGSNRLPDPSYNYGNIWSSYDGGSTWTKTVPSDIDTLGVTVDFEQGNTVVVGYGNTDTIIYVGAGYWDNNDPKAGGQLWKSDDFGTTWSFINYGPTGQNGGTELMPIYDIDVHPNPDSNRVIYIASGENLDYAFLRSTDGGDTYEFLNVSGHGAFSSVLVNKNYPHIVEVAARRNLFRYNVSLSSNTTVFEGLPGEFVPDLETGSTLLGTTTGLYKLVEEPGSVITVWNGTGDWSDASKWSNGVPYEIADAIVESGSVTVDISGKANDVSIVSGAAITISEDSNLTLGGDLILESDETGYASLIESSNLSVEGEITIQRYISEDQWHYITPPVSNAQSGVFTGLWLDHWDETTGAWVSITSTTEDLLAGKGYKTWASSGYTGNITLEFIGILNSGDYSPEVTLSGPADDFGWNLIGNDFPSAIDWGTDNDPNSELTLSNIDNTIYLWTGTQYATYNPSGNGGEGLGTNGGSRYIAALQGFFVHANDESPSLTIPNSARIHSTQQFRNIFSGVNSLNLTVNSDTYSDEINITINEESSTGFDWQYDAYKLFGINNAPQLYSEVDFDILSVNNLPFEEDKADIPVGLIAGNAGTHTISATGLDNFDSDIIISLEDKLENITIDLRIDTVYTFFASPSDDPSRFVIHIDATTVGNFIFDDPEDILIYEYENKIYIKNIGNDDLDGKIMVYDILGRMLLENSVENTKEISINNTLSPGTYIIMYSSDKKIITKRIIKK